MFVDTPAQPSQLSMDKATGILTPPNQLKPSKL